jgi:hypothetical protein
MAGFRNGPVISRSAVRAIGVVALAVFAFAAFLPNVATYFLPLTGTFGFELGLDGRVALADPKSMRAGISVGDRIDYAKMPLDARNTEGAVPGTRLVFPVLHDGKERHVTLVAHWERPALLSATLLVVRKLAWVFFVVIAAAIVLLRPSHMTWGFYLYSLDNGFTALIFYMFLPHVALWTLQYIADSIGYLGQLGFVVFALRFPQDAALGWRARVERLVPAIAVALLAFYAIVTVGTLSGKIAGFPHVWFECFLLLPLYVVAWYALIDSYRHSRGIERIRLRWGIFGSLAGTMIVAISIGLSDLPSPIPEWVMNLTLTVGELLVPLAIGYAIIRHHVIDVQFVLNRTIVFAVIGGAAAGIFVVLDWMWTTMLPLSRVQIGVALAVAFGFGLLVAKTYQRLIAIVDRTLFPKRRAAMERLNELRLTVEREQDRSALRSQLTSEVCAGIQIASAAIFSSAPDGGFVRESAFGWPSGTAWHLLDDDTIVRRLSAAGKKSVRIDDLEWKSVKVPAGAARPMLAVPMTSRRRVVALAFYGAHTNFADIDPDEARGLVDLCVAATPAFDHAYAGDFVPHELLAAAMRNAP